MVDLSKTFDQVTIRAHPQSRRLKLSFVPNRGFLLTHPPRTSRRVIARFLDDQHSWMQDILKKSESAPKKQINLVSYLHEYPTLTLNGVSKSISFTVSSGLLKETDTAILVFPEITEIQLVRKLRDLAKCPLTELLLQLSKEVGVEINRVQIRDQRTRWGSCSRAGNISLNWRIILMPHSLQRHILLHELAHIPHPNHSSRFWNCLKSWDPDTDLHRSQIRQQGSHWISLGRI